MDRAYYLRDGVREDVDLLFHWANDPDVRRNSFCTTKIEYEEHVQWYQRLLENKDAKQYILVLDGKDVGQVRVNVKNDVAEIGYSIAYEERGKQYGKLIIQLAIDVIKRDFSNVRSVVAKVKSNNEASKKIFIENKFIEKCIVYEYQL